MQRYTVRRLSVGFGPAARPALQRDLDAMAAAVDLATDDGRREALRRVSARLRADLGGATHALAVDAGLDLDHAPPFFDAMAAELRARFPYETRRNAVTAPAAVETDPTVPGHLVVSLVLGTVGALASIAATDRPTLGAALDALHDLDAVVVALEVIWSPSVEADRMSLSAMLDRYPELSSLDA
jgi:uncharacterized membrane protein